MNTPAETQPTLPKIGEDPRFQHVWQRVHDTAEALAGLDVRFFDAEDRAEISRIAQVALGITSLLTEIPDTATKEDREQALLIASDFCSNTQTALAWAFQYQDDQQRQRATQAPGE